MGEGRTLFPKDITQSRRQCPWCQLSGAPLCSKPPQVEGKWIQISPPTPIKTSEAQVMLPKFPAMLGLSL